MPDISMCLNKKCPSWEKCHRAQAKPNPHRQTYAGFQVGEEDKCEYFWEIGKEDGE